MKTIALVVAMVLLAGCAGYVGGDLADTPRLNLARHRCADPEPRFAFTVETTAEDDYANQNLAGYLSALTLGLLPTYWASRYQVTVDVFQQGQLLRRFEYRTRIHKFYGWLWLLVLPKDELNRLLADEGAGIRVRNGVMSRAAYKAVEALKPEYAIRADAICFRRQ